jgi:two-component system response regulator AtoC
MYTTPVKILLIEDDIVDQEHFSRTLKKITFDTELTISKDFVDVEDEVLQDVYDVIFLDYYLQSTEAPEILNDLQSYTLSTPFVVLSGKSDIDQISDVFKYGAYRYMDKDELSKQTLMQSLIQAYHVQSQRKVLKESISLFQGVEVQSQKDIKQHLKYIHEYLQFVVSGSFGPLSLDQKG